MVSSGCSAGGRANPEAHLRRLPVTFAACDCLQECLSHEQQVGKCSLFSQRTYLFVFDGCVDVFCFTALATMFWTKQFRSLTPLIVTPILSFGRSTKPRQRQQQWTLLQKRRMTKKIPTVQLHGGKNSAKTKRISTQTGSPHPVNHRHHLPSPILWREAQSRTDLLCRAV